MLLKSLQEKEMAETQPIPPVNENYADYIVQYSKNIHGPMEYTSDANFQIIDGNFAVLYVPMAETGPPQINNYSYNSIPKCYTYMDIEGLNSSGILRLHEQPYLRLRGQGTAVAIVDSGIDYTHPAFKKGNQTRIAAIWDQSLPENGTEQVPYGREFTGEQIQAALDSGNPGELVPSVDTDGHGTFLAGIAAGSSLPASDFSGAAPEAEIIVVKLKQAKEYLRQFYLIPRDAAAYQENDIMLGIWYAIRKARERGRSLAVCIGMGTNLGAHLGGSPLARYMNNATHYTQNVVAVAAGNEGNTRNHFYGVAGEKEEQVAAELRVGENTQGFVLELWGQSPRFYSLRIQSPTGESHPVAAVRGNGTQKLTFVFVETTIEVSYVAVERESGESLFFCRFIKPAPGVWQFLVSGEYGQKMPFHLWLPAEPFINAETYFLQPSPYTTVTDPGNGADVITVTAYNDQDGSLYLGASRGYTASGYVKPDLAAPGVDILGPDTKGGFTVRSGTSIAAAQTAGAAALLFEWAIARENAPFLNGTNVKNYLIRGAARKEELTYPNPNWGYGTLDLYRVFEEFL